MPDPAFDHTLDDATVTVGCGVTWDGRIVNARSLAVKNARVGVFGLTFKENVADIRNSKVPDIIKELKEFGIEAKLTDPYADPAETKHEYGLGLTQLEEMKDLDALILAVSHDAYVRDLPGVLARVRDGGAFIDVKSLVEPAATPGPTPRRSGSGPSTTT